MGSRISIWLVVASLILFKLPTAEARTRFFSLPPELRGSEESMAKQNRVADLCNLSRISDDQMLRRFAKNKALLPVPSSGAGFYLTAPEKLHFLRPWAKNYLSDLAKRYLTEIGTSLKITELVRTEVYQRGLVRQGKSGADGRKPEFRSAHLTGAAFDISKRDMPLAGILWLHREFVESEVKDLIEATEEIFNNTFHVMVFPDCYIKQAKKKKPR